MLYEGANACKCVGTDLWLDNTKASLYTQASGIQNAS